MNINWKKTTALFLSGQTISLFGSMLVQYAIAWYITLATGSGAYMTLSIICAFLPTFFISFFAGVWADRFNRKILIILADSFIALSTLALAALFLSGIRYIWLLYGALVLRALGTGVQTPAVNAVLPQFVPQDKLTRINSLSQTLMSATTLVSPMIAAALLTFARIETIFFIDVVTAAVAVSIMLLFIKIPAHEKASESRKKGYFSDFREGIGYIAGHKFLKQFFLFNSVFALFVAPIAFLTPLQVVRLFGDDVWHLGAVEIAFSLGMILGGIIMAAWGGFGNKAYTMALANLILGVCGVVLGIIPVFWLYLAVMCVCGTGMPMFNIPATVLIQQKVEVDFLGRVFGVMNMMSGFLMPMGMVIFGPLADVADVRILISGTCFVIVLLSLLMFINKTLKEAGKPVISQRQDSQCALDSEQQINNGTEADN
jgi:DHA3 family macrolide efflux protein-like MFS transporter